MVSGTLSLFWLEVLFTFPSRYSFTIGLTRVFSLAGWSRPIRAGFLVPRVTQDTATPPTASDTGLSPSVTPLSKGFSSRSECDGAVLQPRMRVATHAVWALPRSLATTGGIILLFSFPRGTKMFQFPRLAPATFVAGDRLSPDGLSHSEIRGSEAICASPRLIAAYHVLHRLREPRHPPFALIYFLSLRTHKRAEEAHTFSCFSSCEISKLFGMRRYSNPGALHFTVFACSNMSKIFRTRFPWRGLRTPFCPQPFPRTGPKVENNGFEPLTPCLQSRCSSQLS